MNRWVNEFQLNNVVHYLDGAAEISFRNDEGKVDSWVTLKTSFCSYLRMCIFAQEEAVATQVTREQ